MLSPKQIFRSKLATCMKQIVVKDTISDPLPERDVFQVDKKKCIGQEFKMTVELVGYNMDGVMLDLRSNANIFPNKY